MACKFIGNQTGNYFQGIEFLDGDYTLTDLQTMGLPNFCDFTETNAPTNLVATAKTDERIDLTWDLTGISTGFTLERSLSPTFTSVVSIPIGGAFREYEDSGLTEGTTYYYRIKNGDSDWSNTASAMTFIAFVSEWTTTNTSAGSSGSDEIQLPLISTGEYDFTIDWGDGNFDEITTWNQAETLHTYTSSGNYTIRIAGVIRGWAFANSGDRLKITDVSKWGSFQPKAQINQPSQSSAFWGSSNLDITATDTLDLSQTASLRAFFLDCTSLTFNTSINNWDVSGISDFAFAFSGLSFNRDLDNWAVNGSCPSMFQGASSFDGDLGGSWIITNLDQMFFGASAFTGTGLENWDTSQATGNFNDCFENCTVFNGDISGWDVSGITGGWRDTFRGCVAFNRDLSGWQATGNFLNTFTGATIFNSNLPNWTSLGCSGTFDGCTAFQGNGLDTWDMSSCATISNMLRNAAAFNQDLSSWDVTSLTSAASFLDGASSFTNTNYNNLLVGWESQSVLNNVVFGATGNQSSGAGATARAALIADHTWTFNDIAP